MPYQRLAEKLIKYFAGVLQGSWQSAWFADDICRRIAKSLADDIYRRIAK